MNALIRTIAAVATLLVFDHHAALGQTVLYHSRELPKYMTSRYPNGEAERINEVGQAAGHSDFTYGFGHPIRWEPDGTMLDIGTLVPVNGTGLAEGLNNLGHMAGTGASTVAFQEAFFWSPETGLVGLGVLPGAVELPVSYAHGINDLDEVVGQSRTGAHGGLPNGTPVAFIWDAVTGMRELPSLPGGDLSCCALAVNSQSWVAGMSSSYRGIEACLWLPDGSVIGLGDIGPWSGANSEAEDINELGQIAGTGTGLTGPEAFFWDPKEGMTALGVFGPPGARPHTWAYGLNDHGTVVGLNWYERWMPDEAFIWDREHGLRPLNALLDACSRDLSMFVTNAWDINNRGEIVAVAGYRSSALILTPFTLADMNCDGTVNAFDIDGFILTLGALSGDAADATEYAEKYPGCHGDWAADANQDGSVNMFDIGAFVGMLGG